MASRPAATAAFTLVGNAFEIFLQRAAERDMDLIIPALGDEDDGVGGAVEQSGDARIVGGGAPRPLGHAEGGEMRLRRALRLEEFGVQRIGAGIAALDVVDAERVEQSRDLLLVVERKIDAGGLGAVAQGGVEQSDAFAAHWTCSFIGGELFRHGGVAQHFVAQKNHVALERRVVARGEEALRAIGDVGCEDHRVAGAGELFHRVAQLRRHAPAGEGGMDIEHVQAIRRP